MQGILPVCEVYGNSCQSYSELQASKARQTPREFPFDRSSSAVPGTDCENTRALVNSAKISIDIFIIYVSFQISVYARDVVPQVLIMPRRQPAVD